jgi:hypothetical protein
VQMRSLQLASLSSVIPAVGMCMLRSLDAPVVGGVTRSSILRPPPQVWF